jgi:hypothetical protein
MAANFSLESIQAGEKQVTESKEQQTGDVLQLAQPGQRPSKSREEIRN